MASLFTLDDTLGAVFLGGFAASILFGVTCVQTFIYYQRPRRDTKLLRILVAVLWAFDALGLAFVIDTIYYYTVTKYGQFFVLPRATWSIIASIPITTVIYTIVSSVYAWRIWIVSNRKWYLIIVPVIVCAINIVFATVIAVYSFRDRIYTSMNKRAWMMYTIFSTAAVGDAYVASTLCYYLHKGRTGLKTTDTLINRIMMYCVNTSLLCCTVYFLILITFATMRSNFIYVAIYTVAPKCYCNALLAMLNSREYLRESSRNTRSDDISLALQNMSGDSNWSQSARACDGEKRARPSITPFCGQQSTKINELEIRVSKTAHSFTVNGDSTDALDAMRTKNDGLMNEV